MKKLLAICLCAALTLSLSAALAEATPIIENISGYDFTFVAPDGATVDQSIQYDDMSVVTITPADAAVPGICLIIAPSEEYDNANLADLSTEEQEALFQTAAGQLDAPTYQLYTSATGILYMQIDETSEDADVLDFFTIVDGYCIQAYVAHSDYSIITEADVAYVKGILDTLTVTSVAK